MNLEVQVINKSKHPLPSFATTKSAGVDLRANLEEDIVLLPMERTLVPTGIYIQLPDTFEAQIRPRSGLAINHGITVLNAPGTIDADYTGEIKVILINLSDTPFVIKDGERICQMVVARYEKYDWYLVDKLEETTRGEGGFGYTDK